MFLTLSSERSGRPIRINFDHVSTYENSPTHGGTIIGYPHTMAVTVVTESPSQIDLLLASQ